MRKLAILLILCLLLTACGAQAEPTTVPTTEATEATTVPTTAAPTTEPTTEPTTVPTTEAPILYRHPLTGEPLDAPFTGRPVAVITNNHPSALPHHGVSQADILFEILTEGGITRYLAIYSDLTDVGELGSIRSARTYFISLARSFDAILVHHGGSTYAFDTFATGVSTHLNGSEPHFFRKQERISAGYAYEHTLFTTGEKLMANLTEQNFRLTAKEDILYGLEFSEDAAISGTPAKEAAIFYSVGHKTNIVTFDETTGQYKLNQHDRPYVDGNTDEEVAFSNVLVLYAKRKSISNKGHVAHTLTGENNGYLIMGGQMVPIIWHRDGEDAPFTYTLEDGTPVVLRPGKTYIAVVPTDSTVTAK